MQSITVSLFLLLLLVVSPVRANESLLSEISVSEFLFSGRGTLPTQVVYSWSFSPEVRLQFSAGESWIGVPQRQEIAPDSPLNQLYQLRDFDKVPANHEWAFDSSLGFRYLLVPSFRLFHDAAYHSPFDKTTIIDSYYSPPNGNSFVGTNERFTAMVVTQGPIVDGGEFFGHRLSFTIQFYGVPEPTSGLLLLIGMISMGIIRIR